MGRGLEAPYPIDEEREQRLREWSRGFQACWGQLWPQLCRAEAAADHWYFVAHNPEQVRRETAERLAAFDIAQARRDTAARWEELDRIAWERIARDGRAA